MFKSESSPLSFSRGGLSPPFVSPAILVVPAAFGSFSNSDFGVQLSFFELEKLELAVRIGGRSAIELLDRVPLLFKT